MADQVIIPQLPFVAGAHEHTEQAFTQVVTPTTSSQIFEFEIPSYGYLRHFWLQVVGAGGTGGTANADAPYNLLQDITLLDTNGAPIFGPLDGFAALQSNIWGGYAFQQDPRKGPWYVGTTPNFAFSLRIPIEISHYDGTGALANQNSAAPYKLRFTVAPLSTVWSVNPAPVPAFTIIGMLEAWSLPNEVDGLGRPQAQVPPNHGTVQYWSSRTQTVSTGNNTIQCLRVGNLVRNIIFIARTAGGVRSNTVFPDTPALNWDARQLEFDSQLHRQQTMFEKLNNSTLDTGVFVYTFAHSTLNRVGDDRPTLWLPTVQATRLEVQGTLAAGGTVQIVTNDIAPVEVNPTQRYVERNATGFQPNPDTAARR